MNEFLKDLHDKLDAKLGQDIVTIDFRGHSPLFDYMMIVSALNERNANSLADICAEVLANIIKISSVSIMLKNQVG